MTAEHNEKWKRELELYATKKGKKKFVRWCSNWTNWNGFFGDVKPRITIIGLLLCVVFTVVRAKIIIIIRKNKSWQQKTNTKNIWTVNIEHWKLNMQIEVKCWKRQFFSIQYTIDLVICLFVAVFSSPILCLHLKTSFFSVGSIEFGLNCP